jgi:hypothetical protein
MFWLNYKKPSSCKIRVPNKSYVNYIKPLLLLINVAEVLPYIFHKDTLNSLNFFGADAGSASDGFKVG